MQAHKVIALNPPGNSNLVALLNNAIGALRESAVDELHLAGYYARLLEQVSQKSIRSSRHSSEILEGGIGNPSLMESHEQDRTGVVHPPTQDNFDLTDMCMDPISDWDDWLTFPFDANLASIGELGFHGHLSTTDGPDMSSGPVQ